MNSRQLFVLFSILESMIAAVSFMNHTIYLESEFLGENNQHVEQNYGQQTADVLPGIGYPPLEPSEMTALQDLFESTQGAHWLWLETGGKWNFTGDHNPCTEKWQYLKCRDVASIDEPTSHIDVIAIRDNINMNGSLPLSIGNFKTMQTFDIENNLKLNGTIPYTIGNLTELVSLEFSKTSLTGTLPPEIGQLVNSIYDVTISDQRFFPRGNAANEVTHDSLPVRK